MAFCSCLGPGRRRCSARALTRVRLAEDGGVDDRGDRGLEHVAVDRSTPNRSAPQLVSSRSGGWLAAPSGTGSRAKHRSPQGVNFRPALTISILVLNGAAPGGVLVSTCMISV